MTLITRKQFQQLLANGLASYEARQRDRDIDPHPVVKLFTPDAQCTWLLTEIDPHDADRAFGLCRTLHKPNYVARGIMERYRFLSSDDVQIRSSVLDHLRKQA